MELKHLQGPINQQFKASLSITGSKSETNRLLLLQSLFPQINLVNTSNSEDAQAMARGIGVRTGTIDVHHAGTAMRFLTAFMATTPGVDVVLTGSARMQQRPIGLLVDALRLLGAEINYLGEEGYPPLRIQGKEITQRHAEIPAHVSSQYISALLLVAPRLSSGMSLTLKGAITSIPYIKMTCALLESLGINTRMEGSVIQVDHARHVASKTLVVESDWSSASYHYSMVALAPMGSEIRLYSYKSDSLQGDAVLAQLYSALGVESVFVDHQLVITKQREVGATVREQGLIVDFTECPDIAQTLAVTCFALGIGAHFTGLHTLKIKETDRLVALQQELTKFGAQLSITEDSLTLHPFRGVMNTGVVVATYHDHRMAMAFAPLAMKVPLAIEDPAVVAKSYPDFWNDLSALGFRYS
jgi:3-phosphoshikimate 1-carboxyvinyltransferase